MTDLTPVNRAPATRDHELSDPADVARYGALLHEAAHGPDGDVGRVDCREQVCRQFDRYAETVLAALTADGRYPHAAGRRPARTLAALLEADGNLTDVCGRCVLTPTFTDWTRATQITCPQHGTAVGQPSAPHHEGDHP